MFAKSSTLSSTAAVFTPQGATVASTEYMQQQYYGSSSYECQDSYGMASYSYGYDNSYGQSWNSGWSRHSVSGPGFAKKQPASEVLNLDDFSDLSDSDDEKTPAPCKSKKEMTPPEVQVETETSEPGTEPAEEPSPCATDAKTNFDGLEVASDTAQRTASTSDVSSASSEPEGEMLETPSCVYDIAFLVKLRGAVSSEPPAVVYRTVEVEEKTEAFTRVATPEKSAAKEVRRKPKTVPLEMSENSWGAQQRRLKSDAAGADSKEQVTRTIKSILNKLTLEKFASLSQQLLDCGISSSDELVVLIHEVFEKATTQHHFIDMYADLCVLLHEHFATVKDLGDKKFTFKRLLLDECQCSFERLLTPPTDLDQLPADERTIAEVSYKTHMLGNIKLVGGLLARGMLAAKVGIAILEELLSNPTAEALESVAALLTALGPSADHPQWPQKKALDKIFDQLSVIVKSKSCQTRERCLLKDLLDLRGNRWVDRRPKKLERAMTLAQVAEGGAPPAVRPAVRKVTNSFDQDKFRQCVRSLLRDADSEALQQLRGQGAPPAAKQPTELAEFLSQVVQEPVARRDHGFKALLKLAGEWHSEALAQGVRIFVTDLAADLALDVPNLPAVLEEFYKILVATRTSPAAQQALKRFQAK